MRLKSKILAALAAATMAGGIAATAAVPAATAATPSCGQSCVNGFNDYTTREFIADVYKRGTAVGTPIVMFQKTNEDPAEDFTVFEEGLVGDFFKAGLVSAAFNLHYHADVAIEVQYTPYGVGTGLCAGLAAAATQGAKVSLQPCGVTSETVWAADFTDPDYLFSGWNFALANGSTSNFSFPQVLTYPANSWPTDSPRPQLDVEQITGFFGQNPVTGQPTGPSLTRQQWSFTKGPIQ